MGKWKKNEPLVKPEGSAVNQTTSSSGQAETHAERVPELEVEQLEVLGHSRAAVSTPFSDECSA